MAELHRAASTGVMAAPYAWRPCSLDGHHGTSPSVEPIRGHTTRHRAHHVPADLYRPREGLVVVPQTVAFRGCIDVFGGRLGLEDLAAGHTQAILPTIPTEEALVTA
jgi:hypothetical protein